MWHKQNYTHGALSSSAHDFGQDSGTLCSYVLSYLKSPLEIVVRVQNAAAK